MKKYFLFLLIIVSILFSQNAYALVLNSGFIPGQIWYSEEKLIEGDTVNIHTAVWNGEKSSISVKVEFYDKNIVLGNRDIVIDSLELKDVHIPWKVTSGDHVISAKIISSLSGTSNNKEKVTLSRTVTSNDKQFVSVVVKDNEGEIVTGTDLIQNKLNKASSDLESMVPENISDSVSSSLSFVDDFRIKTLDQVNDVKEETKDRIDLLKKDEVIIIPTSLNKSSIEDATEKPIAYIKLFLFSILSFILTNKIVFYGVLVLVAFLVLRFIYRRIRNK